MKATVITVAVVAGSARSGQVFVSKPDKGLDDVNKGLARAIRCAFPNDAGSGTKVPAAGGI